MKRIIFVFLSLSALSPAHAAYGVSHATVDEGCVTRTKDSILSALKTLSTVDAQARLDIADAEGAPDGVGDGVFSKTDMLILSKSHSVTDKMPVSAELRAAAKTMRDGWFYLLDVIDTKDSSSFRNYSDDVASLGNIALVIQDIESGGHRSFSNIRIRRSCTSSNFDHL